MAKVTQKQEAFARAYVETGNASEAYRRAYDAARMKPEAIHVNASKLLADTKVALRVDALQEKHAKRHDITVDRITEMLLEDRTLARSNDQPAAAVSATMGIAKLHGLIIDRSKVELATHEDALTELRKLAAGGGQ